MADLQTQIAITADASGVEAGVGKAKRSLADLGATAAAAGKQASEGLSGAGNGAEGASRKIDATTKNIIGSIQRQIATMEAGSKTGSKYFEAVANQRGANLDALRPYLAQLDQVAQKQQTVTDGFAKLGQQGRANLERISLGDKLTQGLSAAGRDAKVAADSLTQASKTSSAALRGVQVSAGQTAAALRQVPAQFTDIATSLAAGQSPLTVLLQQGGQLKDSFGGIAPAAQALGRYITGLINPFTVAAGAAGVLALAYNQGSKEADAFAKAIILSGNAAGTTIGQLQAQAAAISQVVGTQGQAAEALAEFATQGQVAGENLQRFATVAVRLERVAGQAVADAAKQFADLAKDPLAAALKLNESTNFLTRSLYEQIKALDETGRTADAAAAAQRGYAEALESRATELENRLGAIESAWKSVKDAASAAWDAMLNVGRPDTLQTQLQKAQVELERARANQDLPANLRGDFTDVSGTDPNVSAIEGRIADLQKRIDLENQTAQETAKTNKELRARAQFDKDGLQYLDKEARLRKEIREQTELGLAAGLKQSEIDQRIAAIREKYRDKSKRADPQKGIDRSELAFDLGKIKAESDQLVNIYNNSERVLEALRSAGLVDEREYYEAKRGFIQLESEAKERASNQEVQRLLQERLTGKEAIDRDRKVAEVQAKLALDKANASSQLEVLAIQEEAAVKRLGLAYLTARQAAQDYYDTTQRQQQRQLEGVGQGNEVRARNAGISQIEDRFADQRRELENQKAQLEFEGKFTAEAQKQYEQRLGLIREFQDRSLQSFNAYYDALLQKQKDATVGASEATRNYISDAKNVAAQTEEIFSNAFSGAEDALANFITKGSADLKGFVDAIARDMARATSRQVIGQGLEFLQSTGSGGILGSIGDLLGGGQQAASTAGQTTALTAAIGTSSATNAATISAAIGASTTAIVTAIGTSGAAQAGGDAASLFASSGGSSGFGASFDSLGSFFGGFFADGGDPPLGKASVVGERGPELFVPKSRGTIVPLDKPVKQTQEGARAISVTNNFTISGPVDRRTQEQIGVAALNGTRRAVARGTA